MSVDRRAKLPLRLRTRGLRRALFEAFNDGAWHDVREVLPICRRLISPEVAVRTARATSPTATSADRGMLLEAITELRKGWLASEWERARGPRGRTQFSRFRIHPGQAPRFSHPALTEQEVIDIKLRLARGEPARAIETVLGLANGVAHRIKKGQSYRTITIVSEAASVNGNGRAEGLVKPLRWVEKSAEGFARAARKHLSSDEIRHLIGLLQERGAP